MVEYEYRVLKFTRECRGRTSEGRSRTMRYGHWELHRTRIYLGGVQRTWLRRRIIRATRTA